MPMHRQRFEPGLIPLASAAVLAVSLAAASPAYSASAPSEPIKPVKKLAFDPAKAELGNRLYHDKRLSGDNTVSCATCHPLDQGGTDNKKLSEGIDGKLGLVNAPTVFNTGLLFSQFWDGRALSLADQIDGPVQNPDEMGSLWPDVVAKLYEDDAYAAEFKAVYPDGISRKNIKNAIAEFELSLNTVNSRFDQYLLGDNDAINEEEKNGYQLFKQYGCISCHQGAAVGGNMYQVFGVINNYFQRRGNITTADLGRYNVTGNVEDRHMFKVPSLRMVALTAPYLHDGNAKTLRDAVDKMFEFQLGREAPDEDKDAIVAFLKTLPGEYKGKGL